MKLQEVRFTRLLASRSAALILAMIAAGLLLVYNATMSVPLIPGNRGIVFTSSNLWFEGSAALSFVSNIAVLGAIAGMMMHLNSRYNILRSFSLTFVGVFLLAMAAVPSLAVRLQGGGVSALIMLMAMTLLYSIYNNTKLTRRVFLAFFLVSGAALWQYAMVVYLPVLLLGCAQMRVLNARNGIAALLGTVTPLWLVWGFSAEGTVMFHAPDFTPVVSYMGTAVVVRLAVTIGVMAVLSIGLAISNVVKIFSYNAHARAVNGLLTVVSLVTAVMVFIDVPNFAAYFTLLALCLAFQTGHFFAINRNRRSYVLVLALIVAFIGCWVWALTVHT